jgi:hypothetical protein
MNNQRTKNVNTVGLVLEVDVLNNTNGILNVSSSANVNANIISVNLLNVDDNYYTGEYNVIHSEGGDVNSEAFVIVDNPNYRAEFVVDETGKNGYVKIICVNPLTDSTCDSSFGTTENLNNDACSIESLNAVNLQNNINNIMYDSSYGDDLKNVMNILNADYDNYSKNMINMMPMLNTTRILNLREINLGYNSSFGLVSESNNKADYFLRYDSYFSDGLHWFWNVKSVNYRDSASCNNVNKMYSNFRKNALVGIIEKDDFSIHVSEWWNGEGLDFSIDVKGSPPKIISLHSEELESLVILAAAMKFIDFDYIKYESDGVIEKTEEHNKASEKLRTENSKYFRGSF